MVVGSIFAIRGVAGNMLARLRKAGLNKAYEGNFENLKGKVYVRGKGRKRTDVPPTRECFARRERSSLLKRCGASLFSLKKELLDIIKKILGLLNNLNFELGLAQCFVVASFASGDIDSQTGLGIVEIR